VLFSLLAACRQRSVPQSVALDGMRRQAVLSALDRARDAFNHGDCQSIYLDASIPFRVLEGRGDWLSGCEQLRVRLGRWVSFHPAATDARAFQAHVSGSAIFTRGTYRLSTTWNLEAGHARLFSLYIQGAGLQAAVPPARIPPPRFIDPPPRLPKAPS
jgi:hypothetical protein